MTSDFRSDTVTRPSESMRRAMASAEVGDDVFGDDPTVIALEERVAALFGKQAALFCPSGTMANQIAIGVRVRPGDEIRRRWSRSCGRRTSTSRERACASSKTRTISTEDAS